MARMQLQNAADYEVAELMLSPDNAASLELTAAVVVADTTAVGLASSPLAAVSALTVVAVVAVPR